MRALAIIFLYFFSFLSCSSVFAQKAVLLTNIEDSSIVYITAAVIPDSVADSSIYMIPYKLKEEKITKKGILFAINDSCVQIDDRCLKPEAFSMISKKAGDSWRKERKKKGIRMILISAGIGQFGALATVLLGGQLIIANAFVGAGLAGVIYGIGVAASPFHKYKVDKEWRAVIIDLPKSGQ